MIILKTHHTEIRYSGKIELSLEGELIHINGMCGNAFGNSYQCFDRFRIEETVSIIGVDNEQGACKSLEGEAISK